MVLLFFVMNSPLHAQLIEVSFDGIKGKQEACEEVWTFHSAGADIAEIEVSAGLDPCTHVCFTVTLSSNYSGYTVTPEGYNCAYPLPYASGYVATFCIGPDACINEDLPTDWIDITIASGGNNRGSGSQPVISTCSVMIGN